MSSGLKGTAAVSGSSTNLTSGGSPDSDSDSDSGDTIHWRTLAIWLAAASGLGGLGSYLAYESSLSSEAWRQWAGSGAWKRDLLRMVLASALAMWIVSQLGLKRGKPTLNFLFPRRFLEWIFFILLTLIFLWLTLIRLPESFEAELSDPHRFGEGGSLAENEGLRKVHERMDGDPEFDRFAELKRPAIPYLLYEIGFWWGIVWPTFLLLVRTIRRDRRTRKASRERYHAASEVPDLRHPEGTEKVENAFEGLRAAFRLHEGVLAKSAQRYPTIVLILSLGFLYEQLTPSGKTLLPESVEFGKFVLWVMLGPALCAFLFIALVGYQRVFDRFKDDLRRLMIVLTEQGESTSLVGKVMSELDQIMWSRGPVRFVFSVVRSANFAIPLMISLVGYVVHTYTRGKWIELFAPRMVIDYIERLYQPDDSSEQPPYRNPEGEP